MNELDGGKESMRQSAPSDNHYPEPSLHIPTFLHFFPSLNKLPYFYNLQFSSATPLS